ncbi:aminotransferase class I/II-fold pyridoxal phosphate-dependent enzyme [Legionella nagasakiensis]|uniref:aminotransferase class I/II-fold pyridoxal phosphate-dependent enzyme n=1 Tax=Legionella nagasakiensis TaxID=535290 RepID=UPI001F5F9F96|nr:8-amino-7-oxononanoate synthase [Legionella nagasakiensis]
MLTIKLQNFLSQRQECGLYRKRQLINQNEINFSSNDYLSLSNHTSIKQAYEEGFQRYSTGSGGSMVVCGYHPIHRTLEQTFAEVLKVDQCLLFSSGYAANLSVAALLGCLCFPTLIDKAAHASIYDGLKLSNVNYLRYRHNDMVDLSTKIKRISENAVIMTESVFSMSGQIAPLAEMVKLSRSSASALIVDEAHAFGVMGRQGMGAVRQTELTQDEVPLRVIPFGKAYASAGAIVAGKEAWIEALLQCARPYIYSTAISPAIAYGLLKSLDIIRSAEERRIKLQETISYFRNALRHSSLKWRDSLTAIQQLQLGCPHRAQRYAMKLREQGIVCIPMRPPTVSRQETGLRIILNCNHQAEHIDYLMKCLHQL